MTTESLNQYKTPKNITV